MLAEEHARETMSTDVLIVGAGPAGLAAAIRLKQQAALQGSEIAVTVVEKSAEVGGHILSGAVLDPVGLDELIPDWRTKGAPVGPQVKDDHFRFLTEKGAFTFPNFLLPPQMKTRNGVIISLGELCKWLAGEAEALGVEIYPMTPAVDVITNAEGAVEGIITGDLGVAADGTPKDGYAQGIALKAKYTLIGEGARGSLAKKLIAQFELDKGKSPQKYSLGIKEIWEIPADQHHEGKIEHFMGWPLDNKTSGGGFLYHAADRKVYLGFVTYLDYANPTLSPFGEFQRFKTHPAVAKTISNGTRVSYGARALTSGGWQSIPDLAFPGGALIGCSAGFMNVPRLKGIHSAMRSGMAAAEAVAAALAAGRANDRLETLQQATMASGIARELRPVRNVKPLWGRYGTLLGVFLGGVEMWLGALLSVTMFGTLRHRRADFETTEPKGLQPHLDYPRPDGVTTFDKPASVFLANLAHDEDQPVHLRLADPEVPIRDNLPIFGEPAPLYCPAGVYELAEEGGKPVFRINAANCVHCKTCDIKDPAQNINWVPPEGGSGPNYAGM